MPFANYWTRTIEVEGIADHDASTGAASVVSGGGQCLPENSDGLGGMGTRHYQTLCDLCDREPSSMQVRTACAEVTRSLNKKHERIRFDPLRPFDVATAEARLRAAVASRQSAPEGAKIFTMPLQPGTSVEDVMRTQRAPPSAGTHQVVARDGDPCSVSMVANIRVSKDERSSGAMCARCGSPHDIRTCAGCSVVRYCGSECAGAAWRAHKPECRALAAAASQGTG